MFRLILQAVGLFSLFISTSSLSYDEKADVLVRVVDVGTGLCTITKVPDEYLAYLSAATEAGEIVGNMTGNVVTYDLIQPELPSAG